MTPKLKRIISVLILSSLSVSAYGAACTYGEAMMALEKGNERRGMALMQMAAKDGDVRANRYLVSAIAELKRRALSQTESKELILVQISPDDN